MTKNRVSNKCKKYSYIHKQYQKNITPVHQYKRLHTLLSHRGLSTANCIPTIRATPGIVANHSMVRHLPPNLQCQLETQL